MTTVKDWSRYVLLFVTIALLGLNVLLIVQNYRLKKALEQSKQLITEEGFTFDTMNVRGLNGDDEQVNFSKSHVKTVLLVFDPSCEYCVQQYPYWKVLVENMDSSRWRVLAITSESDFDKIRKHLESHKFDYVRIGVVTPDEFRKARMLFTPMTLAIDVDGEVKKVWPGLWRTGFNLP